MDLKNPILCLLTAALALFALASGASGQVTNQKIIREGAWNTSLSSARSVARYSGRPVMVFFFEDWCGYCEQLEKILVHRDLRDALKRFILVKLTPEEADLDAAEFGMDGHHKLLMLDWSGKPVGRVMEIITPKEIALTVIEAAAENDMSAGEKLEQLGYRGKAAERYELVKKISRNEATVARAVKALDKLLEESKRQVALIRDLVAKGRIEEARDACNQFLTDYPPDMGRDEVEKILVKLKTTKPVGDVIQDVTAPATDAERAEAEAKKLLERGMVDEWDKRFYRAVRSYRTASEKFAETPSGKEASERLKLLMDSDEKRTLVTKQEMDAKCDGWLHMAELYEKNGYPDHAIEYYRLILTNYPASDWAEKARERLKKHQSTD